MPKTSTKPLDTEHIAEMAVKLRRRLLAHLTVVRPAVQRINVDFTAPMLKELDREAKTLNVSRQAVIKTMLREALDRRYIAQQARQGKA